MVLRDSADEIFCKNTDVKRLQLDYHLQETSNKPESPALAGDPLQDQSHRKQTDRLVQTALMKSSHEDETSDDQLVRHLTPETRFSLIITRWTDTTNCVLTNQLSFGTSSLAEPLRIKYTHFLPTMSLQSTWHHIDCSDIQHWISTPLILTDQTDCLDRARNLYNSNEKISFDLCSSAISIHHVASQSWPSMSPSDHSVRS